MITERVTLEEARPSPPQRVHHSCLTMPVAPQAGQAMTMRMPCPAKDTFCSMKSLAEGCHIDWPQPPGWRQQQQYSACSDQPSQVPRRPPLPWQILHLTIIPRSLRAKALKAARLGGAHQ